MGKTVYSYIIALVDYAEEKGLADKADRMYYINRLLELLQLDGFEETSPAERLSLQTLLDRLCDFAVEQGIIEDGITDRDLLDTRIMGVFTPLPSAVIGTFETLYASSPETATEFFYTLSMDTNYIRTQRVAKDLRWKYQGKYGELDVTVNLSKPEKDPKAIAAAKNAGQSSYPKCQLCPENVGYHGRADHPARQNLRTIPLTVAGEAWHLQYSPYVYYNEHCILLKETHSPMSITHQTFARLLDFTEQFPHYFIGSNADLPIVGGSILTHDHFQGGKYTFAMEKASCRKTFVLKDYPDLRIQWLHWPLSVLRITGEKERVYQLACLILDAWRSYSDPDAMVIAADENGNHNTITPIARREGDAFQLDLVLRNNITTPEHPMGLYHPHAEKHHIKKENIGLIEVMGLAVLPSRLKAELKELEERHLAGLPMDTEGTAKHALWWQEILTRREVTAENISSVLEEEVGRVFEAVLEDAGVYSPDERGEAGISRFVASLEQ